jgi:hypothetical protein
MFFDSDIADFIKQLIISFRQADLPKNIVFLFYI